MSWEQILGAEPPQASSLSSSTPLAIEDCSLNSFELHECFYCCICQDSKPSKPKASSSGPGEDAMTVAIRKVMH